MKITLLGCGTSVGIPALGVIGWGKCNPKNPKNFRQRSSILIENRGKTILVDAGPDVRNQLLNANVMNIDAVLITHGHADHISGLPELRPFYFANKTKIPIYSNDLTLKQLKIQFEYLFKKGKTSPSYYKPPMSLNKIYYGNNTICGFDIKVLKQYHGNSNTLGFIFNNKFAYCTDVVDMPKSNFKYLNNMDLFIIGALREEPHESHAHFKLAFDWSKKINSKKTILTHLGVQSDYDYVSSICPKNVFPGYDGMSFKL